MGKLKTIAINRKGQRVVVNLSDFREGGDELWEDYVAKRKKSHKSKVRIEKTQSETE